MDTKEKIAEVKFSCKQGSPPISAIVAVPVIFNIILKSHTEPISVKYVSAYLFFGFLIGGIIFFSERTAHIIVRKHELVLRGFGVPMLSIDITAIKSIKPADKRTYSSMFSSADDQLTIFYNDRTINVSLHENDLFSETVNRLLAGGDLFKDIVYSEKAEKRKSTIRSAAAMTYIVANAVLCSGTVPAWLHSIPAVVVLLAADILCLILYARSYKSH